MGSPTSTKIPVGTVLSGKYKVTREIGRGGMAAVYEAENVDIGKRVAIKVLAQELTTSGVVVERFFREARAAAAIRSPYICDVYDSGRLEEGPPFLVLELLEGESLYERMTKVRYFDIQTTLSIVTQACRGLTKAHAANIVHRDLKPENIFLTKDEEGELLAKILDFGLAKFYTPLDGSGGPQQARLTREGAVFGTPAYMSPEQVRGQGAVDQRADLWALGCIVYECFTGRTVWQTEQGVAMTFAQIASAPVPDPLVFRPDLPQTFKLWFQKALDRRIDQRFQTAREFAEELGVALEVGRPTSFSGMFGPNELAALANKTVPAPPPSMSGAPAAAPDSTLPPTAPAPNLAPQAGTPAAGTPDVASPRGTKAAFEAPPRAQEPGAQGAGLAQPPKRSNAAARVAIGAVALALVGGGAYAGWKQMSGDGSLDAPKVASTSSASGPADTARPRSTADVKAAHDQPSSSSTLPWRPLVADAQAAIAKGEPKEAFKLLKDAFDKGGHGVPRTMLEHVQIAISEGAAKSPCTLGGLGRPRTYDLAHAQDRRVNAGRPAIALGERGPVMVWTDTHNGPEHAYAVLLDDALRPLSEPIDVTPEGGGVTRPVLASVDGKLLLVYADGRGSEAGVHARVLDPDGRIGGPMMTLAPLRGASSGVGIDRAPDGSYFVTWTAEDEKTGHEELYVRRLSPKLEPVGEIVRVTDVPATGPLKPRARAPSIAVVGDAVHLAFRLERMPQHMVEHVRVPIADLDKGLPPRDKSAGRKERFLGESALMNKDRGKSDAPSIACSKDACFFAWSRESTGGQAHAAFIDPAHAEPLWRNPFAARGSHPVVAVDEAGRARMVWFERGGVMTVALGRDGVEKTVSKLARVSGDQPTPSLVPGKSAGEWYFAWLDFEAGYLEPYAARFVCR